MCFPELDKQRKCTGSALIDCPDSQRKVCTRGQRKTGLCSLFVVERLSRLEVEMRNVQSIFMHFNNFRKAVLLRIFIMKTHDNCIVQWVDNEIVNTFRNFPEFLRVPWVIIIFFSLEMYSTSLVFLPSDIRAFLEDWRYSRLIECNVLVRFTFLR